VGNKFGKVKRILWVFARILISFGVLFLLDRFNASRYVYYVCGAAYCGLVMILDVAINE
jgi:hypothetical protein